MTHTTYRFNMTSSHVTNYFVTWAATIPMVTVSVVALAANCTVLVMFALRPSLRRSKNAYIGSLALADFLIGCYMPLVALEEVGLVTVSPGPGCRAYLTVRYSLLYVSLLSVVFITLDRWWSVRWPFSYRTRHTRRMAAYIISVVWAVSVALYALPIFLWEEGEATSASSSAHHLNQGRLRSSADVNHKDSGGYADVNGETAAASSASRVVVDDNEGDPSSYGSKSKHGDDGGSGGRQHHLLRASGGSRCEVPYALSFTWSAVTCCLMHLLPLVAMWIINCSLYHKIRQRRSVEIRRSTSVTDTFFVTVKNSKPTIQITEAPSLVGPPSYTDFPCPSSPVPTRSSSPTRQQMVSSPTPGGGGGNNLHPGYASPNMGRRHSSALVTLSPQTDRRQISQRRVSLPDWALRGDCSPTANNSSQCRYVGRKWSGCGGASTPIGQGGLGLGSSQGLFGSNGGMYGAGAGAGGSSGGGRPPGEDMVHELLVKQDQKAACCLGLLLAACTLCWLPFAFLTLVRANCPLCVSQSALAVTRWLLLANSAINPFLYGLLNAQFRNILRQWFYLDTSRRYRPKDTYIYMGVTKQEGVGESLRDTSNVCLSVKVP